MTKTPTLIESLDSFVLKSLICVPGQIPAPANSHIWTSFGRTFTNVIYLIINILTGLLLNNICAQTVFKR